MSNKSKILVVEDEKTISNFVKTDLEASDYQVFLAYTLKEGEMMFLSYCPDLIILDLGLPDGDGNRLIQKVRESSIIPIIVLSARPAENEKVEALDLGANDFVTKPFSMVELQARIRANLRISHQQSAIHSIHDKFELNGLTIDYDQRQIFVNEKEVKLTQTEYNIMALLAEHAGRVMTYSEIIKNIWNWAGEGSVKKLQVNMANIRKKLGEKPGENKYITNELGVGYRIAREK